MEAPRSRPLSLDRLSRNDLDGNALLAAGPWESPCCGASSLLPSQWEKPGTLWVADEGQTSYSRLTTHDFRLHLRVPRKREDLVGGGAELGQETTVDGQH